MGQLVGREDETARLHAFVAELAGGPSALVVEGEPGIGKTALFEALLAQAAGPRVLRARCAQAESGLAYAGLADLLGRVTDTVLAALPSPQRRPLEVVLGRAEVGQDPVEPHLVGRATLGVLRSLAAATPLLVALDDVQWLDPASARTLTFALRRLEAVPVGVLVTRREPGGPLPLGLDDALPQGRRDRLLVGPLDPDHLELLVEELLADRLERLPSDATEPLAAVAGLAAPTVGLIAAVLGEHAKTALDTALDAGVLLVEEGRLRFSHPLFGVAASARLAPSARRALHARLAATLVDPEERARHLVLAVDGPDAGVAAAVEQGADRARARGAPEVTAGEAGRGRAHLAAALEAAPPGRVRADLRWRLGMLVLADDVDGAVELLEAALAESRGDQALQAMVARRLAGPYWWQGRLRDALRLIRRAVEQAEALGDPRGLLDALNLNVLGARRAGKQPPDLPGRVERLARAARPLPAHEDPDLILSQVDLARGDTRSAATRLERLYRRAIEQGNELGLVWAPAVLAEVELARGRWPRAQRLAGEALRTARRLASPFWLARGLLAAALVDAHLGNAQAARTAALELLDAAERGGLVPLMLEGRAVLGFVALSRGDAKAAHAELGPLLERLGDAGVREPTWARLVWSELDALVELGELDRAAALAEDLEARGRALDRPFARATAARARGLVLAARGDLAGG